MGSKEAPAQLLTLTLDVCSGPRSVSSGQDSEGNVWREGDCWSQIGGTRDTGFVSEGEEVA